MASVGNSSWSNILSQKTDTFQQQGFALIISEIKNESSFRKFFETTCLRIQEYKSVSLLNTLLPSFHNVKEFTGLINGVRDGDRPGKLMEIIWGGTCAVIQVCQHPDKLRCVELANSNLSQHQTKNSYWEPERDWYRNFLILTIAYLLSAMTVLH